MKREYDDALCEEFPLLYADRTRSWREVPLGFGIECKDGWYPLLRELSAKLETLIMRLPEDERSGYRAAQVKEKLGTLRFHMSKQTPEMFAVISEAEELSGHTCEYCGAPGTLRRVADWRITLCDDHHAERERRFERH
ncbi:MAG: hypothetical protein ABW217_02845 [Polyangiaceae bacterium]